MDFPSVVQALERSEYWRLSDEKGKPPGVLGWWPSRAVTFIENHDTGSTQVPVLSRYVNQCVMGIDPAPSKFSM